MWDASHRERPPWEHLRQAVQYSLDDLRHIFEEGQSKPLTSEQVRDLVHRLKASGWALSMGIVYRPEHWRLTGAGFKATLEPRTPLALVVERYRRSCYSLVARVVGREPDAWRQLMAADGFQVPDKQADLWEIVLELQELP